MALFFILQSLLSIPTYIASGLLTTTVLTYVAVLFPALAVGAFLGIRLARRFDEDVFRRVTLLTVLGTGLLALASGLRIL